MKSRIKREAKWLFVAFIAPMVLLIGDGLVFTKSRLPLWRRVLTLEDTCAYGSCLIIPALIFIYVLFIRGFWNVWLRRRTSRLLWIGSMLFALGSGPLLITILLAGLGLTRDPDPNPVGFGILAAFTFWPSVVLIGIGIARTSSKRRAAKEADLSAAPPNT